MGISKIPIFSFLFVFCVLSHVIAQQQESAFQHARRLAGQNEFGQAINIMDSLCKQYPDNTDFVLFQSRLNYWMNKPEIAIRQLQSVWSPVLYQQENFDYYIQLATRLQLPDTVTRLCNTARNLFPRDNNKYLFLQASAFEQMERDDEALPLLKSIESDSVYAERVDYLRTKISQKKKNKITVGLLNTQYNFRQLQAHRLAHVEYMRKEQKHAYAVRLNYGDRFGLHSFQPECDVYFTTSKRTYLYLNTAVADKNTIFPEWRTGAEWYLEDAVWKGSLGYRYMFFSDTNRVSLYTGSFGIVNNNLSLVYRPYVIVLKSGVQSSHVIQLRLSHENSEAFVQFDFQYGTQPYYFISTDLLTRLNAYRTGIIVQMKFWDHYFVQPIVMFEWEEFSPKSYRQMAHLQLMLSRRF